MPFEPFVDDLPCPEDLARLFATLQARGLLVPVLEIYDDDADDDDDPDDVTRYHVRLFYGPDAQNQIRAWEQLRGMPETKTIDLTIDTKDYLARYPSLTEWHVTFDIHPAVNDGQPWLRTISRWRTSRRPAERAYDAHHNAGITPLPRTYSLVLPADYTEDQALPYAWALFDEWLAGYTTRKEAA